MNVDYEGSLWASLLLKKEGKDVGPLIPYITSMSDRAETKIHTFRSTLYFN